MVWIPGIPENERDDWDAWVYPDSNPKPLNAPNQQAKLADIGDLQDKQQLTHQSWGFNGKIYLLNPWVPCQDGMGVIAAFRVPEAPGITSGLVYRTEVEAPMVDFNG